MLKQERFQNRKKTPTQKAISFIPEKILIHKSTKPNYKGVITILILFRLKTLKIAIHICTHVRDCGGITKVKNGFELRAGEKFVRSDKDEQSWVRRLTCVERPSLLVNEANILKKYPKLRTQRYCGKDGFYHYKQKYAHFNSLIKDSMPDISVFFYY